MPTEDIDEPAQFLANTAQCLWMGKKDACNSRIVEFYQQQFIPACEERFKQLTVQPSVAQLSLFSKNDKEEDETDLNKKSEFTA